MIKKVIETVRWKPMNKMFDSISFQAAVYNQPVETTAYKFFLHTLNFITVKFLELANRFH